MKILVLGGTRFFGKHMVEELVRMGNQVTIATRGLTTDNFGDAVNRIIVDRYDVESLKKQIGGIHYDTICDSLAYASNDVKCIMEVASFDRYVVVSSTAVYDLKPGTSEIDYIPSEYTLNWCNRSDVEYGEAKRQVECAFRQVYPQHHVVAVRFPYVIGDDDYTKRLLFYVDHIKNQIPMYVDNYNNQMSFITAKEAGAFLVYIAMGDYVGAVNGANQGTISVADIVKYVEDKTGKKAIIVDDANNDVDIAPYNGTPSYSINTDLAEKLGYTFANISDYIYDLIDLYIEM